MTNQYFWDRIAGRDPGLRAADADRERTGERLRAAHTEGRLDIAEFQERLERCYEAKTVGELGELVRDLPRPEEYDERRSARSYRPWHPRLAGQLGHTSLSSGLQRGSPAAQIPIAATMRRSGRASIRSGSSRRSV